MASINKYLEFIKKKKKKGEKNVGEKGYPVQFQAGMRKKMTIIPTVLLHYDNRSNDFFYTEYCFGLHKKMVCIS